MGSGGPYYIYIRKEPVLICVCVLGLTALRLPRVLFHWRVGLGFCTCNWSLQGESSSCAAALLLSSGANAVVSESSRRIERR